ncbi:MAG TPA: hypothetical protein VHT52_24735 [Stellaceae bacterium]|jgi:hypothetical protein|nr:hypothetical protein [Stellaceae bacterium]
MTTTGLTSPDPTLDQQVTDIAASISQIETLLAAALTTPRQLQNANEKYLSGRWPRKNGTAYAPVIPVTQAPGALVH